MKRLTLAFVLVVMIGCAQQPEVIITAAKDGKSLAFDRNKGNCLACHAIDDGESPGNIGPPLARLSARFRSKADVRAQIDDATQFNPETSMPPFGRNHILTAAEIDRIVDYLWSLP